MSGKLTEEERRTLLKDEYLFLQGQYEDYDKRSLTIKGWVSTGAVTALALGLNASQYVSLLIAIMVGVVVIVVWYLETTWKLFQYAHSDRIRIIEAYFRSDPDILIKQPAPFQAYNSWYKSYVADEPIYEYEKMPGAKKRPRPKYKRFLSAALQRFVCLPYIPLIIVCIASIIFKMWQG